MHPPTLSLAVLTLSETIVYSLALCLAGLARMLAAMRATSSSATTLKIASGSTGVSYSPVFWIFQLKHKQDKVFCTEKRKDLQRDTSLVSPFLMFLVSVDVWKWLRAQDKSTR